MWGLLQADSSTFKNGKAIILMGIWNRKIIFLMEIKKSNGENKFYKNDYSEAKF